MPTLTLIDIMLYTVVAHRLKIYCKLKLEKKRYSALTATINYSIDYRKYRTYTIVIVNDNIIEHIAENRTISNPKRIHVNVFVKIITT